MEEKKLAFLLIEPSGKEYLIDDNFLNKNYPGVNLYWMGLYRTFISFEGFRKYKNMISNIYQDILRVDGYTLNEFIDFINKIINEQYTDIELIRGILKFNIIDNNYFKLTYFSKSYYIRYQYNIKYIDKILENIINDYNNPTGPNQVLDILIDNDRDHYDDVPNLIYELTKLNLLYTNDINQYYN